MRFQVFFCPFGISATSISPSAALPAALFLLAARHREHLRIMTVIRIVLPILKIPQFQFKTSLIKTLNFESPAQATDNFSHGLQRTTRPVFRHPQKSMEWWGGCGGILFPLSWEAPALFPLPPPLTGPAAATPQNHPGDHPAPPRPRGTETAASTAGIANRNTERTQQAAKPLQQQGKLLMAD